MKKAAVILCVALVGGGAGWASALFAQTLDLSNADAVDARDVSSLIRGRTWQWADGAARFTDDGRFLAWYGRDGQAMYAKGQWKVYRWGNLCYFARWNFAAGSRDEKRCFEHLRSDGTLYQRVDNAKDWYAFKSEPPAPGDEFGKFSELDTVTAIVEKIKQGLEAAQRN